MAEFKVVRYENSTDTPIVDGQVLVDMQTTAMSFDINGERRHSNYVFGVYVNVEAYEWYKEDRPLEGKYYLDFNDIRPDDQVPGGYELASVVFNTGQESIVGTQYLYADEPLSGTALLMFTPTDKQQGIDKSLGSPRAMLIFHLDDEYFSEPTGSLSIANSGCSFINGVSRFGSGSLFKSSVGELFFYDYDSVFNSMPESFTVEWWEKAADSNYTGTIRIQINDDVYTVPTAPAGSTRRNPNVWHHVAVSRISNDTSVYVYVDGKMTAIFDTYIDIISSFGILGSSSHVVNISELAFFNYCKYKKEFTPSDVPYKGFGEVSIAVTSDIVGENMQGQMYFSASIPITVRDMFGDPLPLADITIVDPGEHGGYARISQSDSTIYIYPGDDAEFTKDLEFNVYAKYQASLSKSIKVKIFTGAATYPDSEQSGGGSVDLGPIEERLAAVEEISRTNSDEITGVYGAIEDCVLNSDFEYFTTVSIPALTQSIQEDYTATINGLRQEVSNTYATLTALGNLNTRVNECATTSELNAVKDSLSKYALAADLTVVNNKFSDYATISALNNLNTRVNECATISELNTVKNSLSKYALNTDITVINNKFSNYATIASLNNVASDVSLKLDENDFTEWVNNELDPRLTALENSAGSGGGGSTEEVLVSGTAPTIASLKGKTVYICTSVITSLTIGSMDNGHDDATIIFTTGSTFTASFPASMKWISNSAFGVNKTYIVAVCSGIAVASEVINE